MGTPLVLFVLIVVIGLARIKLLAWSTGGDAELLDPRKVLSHTQVGEFRAVFQSIDTDNSGDVDARELRVALEKEGGTKLSQQEAQELIAKADTDGDGKLSFDEFLAAMASKSPGWERIWSRQAVRSILSQHVFAALLLSFVVLPAASSKTFRMLTPCLEKLPDGTRLHRADLAVDCASNSYKRAYATAVVMIFVCASSRRRALIVVFLRNARCRSARDSFGVLRHPPLLPRQD